VERGGGRKGGEKQGFITCKESGSFWGEAFILCACFFIK